MTLRISEWRGRCVSRIYSIMCFIPQGSCKLTERIPLNGSSLCGSCVLVGVVFRDLFWQAEHATAWRSFEFPEECFGRASEQQRSVKIDPLRTAGVHGWLQVAESAPCKNEVYFLAVQLHESPQCICPGLKPTRFNRVAGSHTLEESYLSKKEGRRPKNRPNEEGYDSDPGLASRRDCVLTAIASRPEAVGWAPLV